jgi:signal transduction histidine kinase
MLSECTYDLFGSVAQLVRAMQVPIVFFLFLLSYQARNTVGIREFRLASIAFLINVIYLLVFVFLNQTTSAYRHKFLNIQLDAKVFIEIIRILSLLSSTLFAIASVQWKAKENLEDSESRGKFRLGIPLIILFLLLAFVGKYFTLPPIGILNTQHLIECCFNAFCLIMFMYVISKEAQAYKLSWVFKVGFGLWAIIQFLIVFEPQFLDITNEALRQEEQCHFQAKIQFCGFIASLLAKGFILYGLTRMYVLKSRRNIEIESATQSLSAAKEIVEKKAEFYKKVLSKTFHEMNLPLKSLGKNIEKLMANKSNTPVDYKTLVNNLEMNFERSMAIFIVQMKTYKANINETSPSFLNFEQNQMVALPSLKINTYIQFSVKNVQIAYKNIFFTPAYGAKCFVRISPGEAIQILTNLFRNSCEAYDILGAKRKYIFVKTKVSKPEEGGPRFVRVDVEDLAGGIPDLILPKIWQDEVSTKVMDPDVPVRGFGLGIVKELVEKYGGTINVENYEKKIGKNLEFVMKGARFTIIFPQSSSFEPSFSEDK